MLLIVLTTILENTTDTTTMFDGQEIFNAAKNIYFEGASGIIQLNANADRIQLYSAFYVQSRDVRSMQMIASFTPFRHNECVADNIDDCYSTVGIFRNIHFINKKSI